MIDRRDIYTPMMELYSADAENGTLQVPGIIFFYYIIILYHI